MVLEAGYPNTTGFRKVVKATILVKKKPGMSDEDFIEHYNNKHAQLTAPLLLKHNVISYSLSYCLTRDRKIMGGTYTETDHAALTDAIQTLETKSLTQRIDMLRGNSANMSDFNAICTFVFPDYKALARFSYDPGSKALGPDHENFMVEEETRMMVGDEYMVIEDGVKVG